MAEQPSNNVCKSRGLLSIIVVYISGLLTLSFAVLIVSALAGLQIANTLLRPNPFSSYEAIWPGQPIASLARYVRQTEQGYLACISWASPIEEYAELQVHVAPGAYDVLSDATKCTIFPTGGVFQAVSVTICDNRIHRLELYSRVLTQDDVLLYRGMPDGVRRLNADQSIELSWDQGTYSAVVAISKQEVIVNRVTLTAIQ